MSNSDSLIDEDTRYGIEQIQEMGQTLLGAKTAVLGALLWTIGHGLGGRASKESNKLTASDRLAKMGAGLTASDVLESGGSLLGDLADIVGDATGMALIAEAATGTTIKGAVEGLPIPPVWMPRPIPEIGVLPEPGKWLIDK